MSLPFAQMRDRWSNRAEPAQGNGVLYWHILMGGSPDACVAATDAQDILAGFSGLHLTPREWLHVTVGTVGSTGEMTRAQMSSTAGQARRVLEDVAPIPVRVGRILYHPEAIMLAVEPAGSLAPLRRVARAVAPPIQVQDPWIPHVTVAYSTAEQPVEPIFSVLGEVVPERSVTVDSLTLVIQWGPERDWNWEPVETIQLNAQ